MSNQGDREIEIQLQIENSNELNKFLDRKAKFIGEEHQVDKYFSPKGGKFLKPRPITEWLRLRDSSGKKSINYKNWHHDKDGRSNYCDEYETPLESLDQMEKIFTALNFEPVVVVDKIRKVFRYKDYEISIDSIKDLGDFVEIEFKSKNSDVDPSVITQEMITFLKDLNCGKLSRNYVGYPFQLLFPDEVKYETF